MILDGRHVERRAQALLTHSKQTERWSAEEEEGQLGGRKERVVEWSTTTFSSRKTKGTVHTR